MLSAIFFDLDDTLLDFTLAEAAALRKTLTELSLPAEDAILSRYHAINAAQWAALERGEATRDQVIARRFPILFREMGLEGDPRAAAELYERYMPEVCVPRPGAVQVLEALAPRYPLYIASNGTAAAQRGRLERAGLSKYFQKIFLSQELGANKPSPAFFDRCFAALPGLERRQALMVGDSLTSDILGGIQGGLRTCWYNPENRPRREDIRPDWEIAHLPDLLSLTDALDREDGP